MSLVELDTGATGFRGTSGGYLMAVALRAMSAHAGADRPPRSLTMHLLRPVTAPAVDLDVAAERVGGAMTTVSARLTQDGALAALGIGSFGSASDTVERLDLTMPDVPPPEECVPLGAGPVPGANASMAVEHRPAAPPLPLTGGDRAEILVWMRLGGGGPVDDFDATFLADSGPPALYGALAEFLPMPSADITIHFGAPVATTSPWVLGVFRGRVAGDGYAVDDGELWTPDGRLLLVSRQRRRILA